MRAKRKPTANASKAKRDPRAKFITLCEKRVEKTIKAIRLVGNLSNRSHYKYMEPEVRKVVGTLRREIDALERRFLESGHGDIKFRL